MLRSRLWTRSYAIIEGHVDWGRFAVEGYMCWAECVVLDKGIMLSGLSSFYNDISF